MFRMTVLQLPECTYPCAEHVLGVILLRESRVQRVWTVEGERPLFLRPTDQLLLIAQQIPVQQAQDIPGVVPHLPLQLLSPQHPRKIHQK